MNVDSDKWKEWRKAQEAQKPSPKKSQPKPVEQTTRRSPTPAMDAKTAESDQLGNELSMLSRHLQCDLIHETAEQSHGSPPKNTEPRSNSALRPESKD